MEPTDQTSVEIEETPDLVERFEQSPFDKTVRIDREKGEMYGVRVMGIRSAHNYDYTLEAQRAVVSRYEQMPLGLSHDYSGAPLSVPATWGVLFNPRVDDKGTVADIKFLLRHEQTPTILEDAERDIGLFSLSAVTTRIVEKPKGKVTSFVPVRVDLVTRGATTRRLFEQENAKDKLLAEQSSAIEELKAKVANFEQRLALREAYVEPKTTLEQTIQTVASKYDAKQFWSQTK